MATRRTSFSKKIKLYLVVFAAIILTGVVHSDDDLIKSETLSLGNTEVHVQVYKDKVCLKKQGEEENVILKDKLWALGKDGEGNIGFHAIAEDLRQAIVFAYHLKFSSGLQGVRIWIIYLKSGHKAEKLFEDWAYESYVITKDNQETIRIVKFDKYTKIICIDSADGLIKIHD